MEKKTMVICPDCGKPGLTNGMYSEDFASVLDQSCTECGKRHYVYIGAHDGKHVWDSFRAKYPTIEVESK